MENTTEKKNISPKAPCDRCGKIGAISNIRNHKKTKLCLEFKGSGTPKNSPEVSSLYKNNNDKRKKKLIATIGKDALREKQRLAKQAYRLKQKQSKGIDSKDEVKLTENPALNRELKDFLHTAQNQGLEIIKIAKQNNKQIIPSLCKEVQEKTNKKLLNSIDNINSIKTKEEFLRQFIQKSEIKNNGTAKQYVDDFYKFTYKYTGKEPDFNNLNWLNSYADVYKYVDKSKKANGDDYKDTSKRTLLTALGSITSVLGVNFLDVSEKYKHLAKNYSKNIQKEQMNNVMDESQLAKSISWDDLLKLESLFDDKNQGTDFTRSLFSILTKIPPRRPKDYRIMKVRIKKNKKDKLDITKLDPNYNFVVCSENKLPTRLVFNNYKTASKKEYGQYIIDKIPPRLSKILQEYIVNSDLQTGNFLFHTEKDKNKPYNQGNFSTIISQKIFEEYSGQKIDVNAIRHSYASHIMKQNLSQTELGKIAKSMGTSVAELQNVYNKIDLK